MKELIYIALDTPERALARVAARVARGGHNVPSADVIRRYTRSLHNLSRAAAMVDRLIMLDNSAHEYKIVFTGHDQNPMCTLSAYFSCLDSQ